MRLAMIPTALMTAALLMSAAGAAAQDDVPGSPAPEAPPLAASPIADGSAPANGSEPPADGSEPPHDGGEPAAEALLALIPVEAAGLALRERATTFGAAEMRANSAEEELALLDELIGAGGEPVAGLGVAAVLATTADGAGGILMQVISVPGMLPDDGIDFWTGMLDLANEDSVVETVEIAGKTATTYLSPTDPEVTAHLYSVEGAAWLIIASDQDMLDDVFSQLP
jgi:hypothetical protein